MLLKPTLWTIDQLGAQASLALSVDYQGAPNGRVREVPDRRTIRYYTTIGLLDRPAEMRGRTALYGQRHLLQLVAIKRLQARGLALAEIQQYLLGLTSSALERIAQLPADIPEVLEAASETQLPEPSSTGARSGNFWSTIPNPVASQELQTADDIANASRSADRELNTAALLQGVPLADAVTLLFPAARPIFEEDLSAMRTAAAPLLKLLKMRRLLRPREPRRTS